MSSLKYIIQGIQTVRKNWTLVAIAFLFKFGLALLFLIPLQNLVSQTIGHRSAAESLLVEWDMSVLIDFFFHNRNILEQYGHLILVGVLLTLVLHIFLSGGLFKTLAVSQNEENRTFQIEGFFGWCGRYFWPLLKIAIISAIFYIVITFLFIIFSTLGMRLIFSDFTSEPVKMFVALGRLVVLFFLLLVINMIMTYVKIAVVTNDEHKTLNALGVTIEFLSERLGKAIALYGGLLLGLLAIVAIYWALQKGCGLFPSALTIVILCIVQQVLSVTRSWYRLVGYASQINLYVNNRAIR